MYVPTQGVKWISPRYMNVYLDVSNLNVLQTCEGLEIELEPSPQVLLVPHHLTFNVGVMS